MRCLDDQGPRLTDTMARPLAPMLNAGDASDIKAAAGFSSGPGACATCLPTRATEPTNCTCYDKLAADVLSGVALSTAPTFSL